MNKTKAALLILMIFLAGAAAGVVGTRMVVRHWMAQAASRPERLRELVERHMAARLRLDTGQRQKVDEILAQTQAQVRALRARFTPEFTEILSNAQSEISAVLRPDQQERFRRFIADNRRLLGREPLGAADRQ
jgi:hypothetical protein